MMQRIDGGPFFMGSDRFYIEEAPSHSVIVPAFQINIYVVTNAGLTRFIAATGYVTSAARPLNPADFPDAPPELLHPAA